MRTTKTDSGATLSVLSIRFLNDGDKPDTDRFYTAVRGRRLWMMSGRGITNQRGFTILEIKNFPQDYMYTSD